MEVLRGGRAVHQAEVDARRRLEDALRSRARVFWALSLVTVRQQEHQRRLQTPLRASRRDELIEDDLRTVDEVAVLRFPDDQMRGLLDVVAELEAHRAVLAQRAVVNLERRSGLLDRLQWAESAAIHRVVKHRVAMAERATLDVLAGQPDRNAVSKDRRKRQFFGGGPIHGPFGGIVQHRLAALAASLKLLVEREAVRRFLEPRVDLAQHFYRNSGLCFCGSARWRGF